MSIIELAKFRVKQTIAGERSRGLLKFLAPDILVGLFLGLSSDGMSPQYLPFRAALVTVGISLFTSLAETRRFFFSAGDVENFYFVQPTASSRLASVSGMIFINLAIAAAVFVPVTLVSSVGMARPVEMIVGLLLSACISVSLYFILIFILSSLPPKGMNRMLTVLQVLMALMLLAAFQLSPRMEVFVNSAWLIPLCIGMLALTAFLFSVLPFSENLVSKLGHKDTASAADLYAAAERIKKFLFIRSSDEEAGLMFFLANLFRNSSFRLSTIGVAGTPIMVAVYWSMQRIRFMRFSPFYGYYNPDFVAPIASLVVSGIVVCYFLSQNVLSSRDHDAVWMFESQKGFDTGRFVLGVRKGLLITVHVPVTLLILLVSLFANPPLVAVATAATYYFMVHVAVSWFSVMQKRFPFSVSFAPLGVTETVNLLFMFAYSFLVIVVLFGAFGKPGKLLMVNLFAFILVGVLEYSSVGIVNRRVKLGD